MTKLIALVACVLIAAGGLTACKKKFDIRDVDPGRAGQIRSLGPESQDVAAVSDQLVRSLIESGVISQHTNPPIIHMLPLENNTRHAFNGEVFNTNLKVQLGRDARGRMIFRSGDTMEAVQIEREAKRTGAVDYDPELRARTIAGADYFLRGRADGLANVSTKGQSDTIYYSYKLVDAETALEVWEDIFTTKKEGRDDVIYR